jgi:cytochrome c5
MERKDVMSHKHIATCVVMLGALFIPVFTSLHAQSKTATPAGQKPTSNAKTVTQPEEEGQRVFEQNCSRCHSAPQGFSPRISGTIVRHMRVRANLSRQDEQKLLRFFNP